MYRLTIAIILGAAMSASCGPKYTKLKLENIQTISITTRDGSGSFCAYSRAALRAVVTYKDGKQAQTRLPSERQRGRLRVAEFEWSVSHGTINDEAVLRLPDKPLDWFGRPIRVSAHVIQRPELAGEATLIPRFDCNLAVDARGAEGARGGEAESGGPGEDGSNAEVALAYVKNLYGARLVLLRMNAPNKPPIHYLFDPGRGARFVVDARGGRGGRGGQGTVGTWGLPGQDGQDAPLTPTSVGCADGASGQPGSDGAPGGPGGPGANGGRGGDGGHVVIRYDARFPELSSAIRVRVEGGDAGPAGPAGLGGAGGAGGKGGTGAKAINEVGAQCEAKDGTDGENGKPGLSGRQGPAGQPGTPGGSGRTQAMPANVTALFADEIKRGIPIVASPEESRR